MDAIALLTRDHDVLRTALAALLTAFDPKARAEAFRRARLLLEAHERREEGVFYPAVRRLRSAAARDAVRIALAEHHAIDGILAHLAGREPDDPAFADVAAHLCEAVTAHFDAEERVLFPEARQNLAEERLVRLGRRMETPSDEGMLVAG